MDNSNTTVNSLTGYLDLNNMKIISVDYVNGGERVYDLKYQLKKVNGELVTIDITSVKPIQHEEMGFLCE